ncbi:MAG: M15 family metallopeptidase [Bacilli bacterium]|nr:M15 family metallopeptidase [Bacilli bacterium]
MRKKKRRLKKKVYLFVFLIVCGFILLCSILFYKVKPSFKKRLNNLGYNSKEVSIIMENVPKRNYKFIKKYNKDLVNLIKSKDYKDSNFKKYFDYYEKNSNSDINDIITIVNSGYDFMKYTASSLLADLVKEKYFIYDNTSRYLDYGNSHDYNSKKIVAIVNSNADKTFYSDTKSSNLNDDNLVLVNKFNHLSDNYVPTDLVALSSKYNSGANNKMRKEAADKFMEMVDGALLDNIILKNASAYRSYNYQVNLYNSYVQRDGKEKADIYSARPGYSEHQTGLCTDINTINSSFANTKEAKWLSENAYKYGFILRFPKGKEDITGYKYESWHYRYVGKKVSKIIYENDITLEEYYAYYMEKHTS